MALKKLKTPNGDFAAQEVTIAGTMFTSDTVGAAQAVTMVDSTGAQVPAGTSAAPVYVSSTSSTPLAPYQQLTVTGSVGLTVPTGATYAIIQCEGGVVRWRDDTTAPTASIGMRLLADGELFYDGSLSAIRFILSSGTPILNISYYR